MTAITPQVMAALEKVTDPTQDAMHAALTAMAELRAFFHSLKTATNDEDKDCLDLLETYIYDADNALDELIVAIEEQRG
jgi:hypothetical protein